MLVPFPLTQAELGEMLGAQRPSVTPALSLLTQQGRLERRPRAYPLHGSAPRPPG